MVASISSLPTELLEQILAHLPLTTLIVVERVCTRWAEVISRRHYHPYLASQDWSVRRQAAALGWGEGAPHGLTSSLFRRVHRALPAVWEGRGAPPPARGVTVGGGEEGGVRVTDMATFEDKVYLACWREGGGGVVAGSRVRVYSLASLHRLADLATLEAAPEAADLLPLSPELAQHGATLAVTNTDRRKVSIYDCRTDALVGEVASVRGPVYSLALTSTTLVTLASWSVQAWRLDSSAPAAPALLGAWPDLPPAGAFQSWLEAHGARLSPGYLVTRATRLPTNPGPPVCYLQVRRLDPSTGAVLPAVLRSRALGKEVVEVADIVLSEEGLLATLTMERVAAGPRYLVRVTRCDTGQQLAVLPQTTILSSVQVPVCWRRGQLYMKEVPRLAEYTAGEVGEEDDFTVSLARWDSVSGVVTALPVPTLPSSSALLALEAARLTAVTSELAEGGGGVTVTLATTDFWPSGGPWALGPSRLSCDTSSL